MRSVVLLGLSLVVLVGCATYRDDLARGQHYYDSNQYDNALSVWRMLERDWDSLDTAGQSRYAYLRGMTDYRLGYRADARHWLAVSKALTEKHPGGLDAQSIAQLDQALTTLNQAVYSAGPPTSPVAAGRELTNESPVMPMPLGGTPSAAPSAAPAAASPNLETAVPSKPAAVAPVATNAPPSVLPAPNAK